jgi:hypothetical protein
MGDLLALSARFPLIGERPIFNRNLKLSKLFDAK